MRDVALLAARERERERESVCEEAIGERAPT